MQLSKIGEFGLIKNLRAKCAHVSPNILIGIGDDAAVIKTTAGKTLITSDMMIEGVHFDLAFTTFHQLGYKLLAINISDIFAMGGKPEYFLVSLGIPEYFRTGDIEELYSGLMKISKKFGVTVIGGDTCASKCGFVLSGTLIGTASRIIERSGAGEGDSIYVTGTLGDSAMGLQLLKKRNRKIHNFPLSTPGAGLMKKHLMPEPAPLKSTSRITSMIDISDGLLIDLSHICDESKAGAIIYSEKIPVSRELSVTANKFGLDPLKVALKGGEDYALLFTAPPNFKTNAAKIGEIIKKGRFIVDKKGRRTVFKAEGYEHFKR
ncbi:MAG: thiamine-phosphate kinase [Thermodesulfovibrionia bacterium]|nr:thiamine-phosphate kinase [Thermodesulfovibrionia bacterium]